MKKLLQHLFILGIFSITGFAQVVVKYQDYVTKGNTQVVSGGVGSTNKVVGSFPSATVTVYLTGTVTLATLYSDDALTPKSNPFTATSEGYYEFYVVAGTYDLRFSGTGISTPFTRSTVEILGNSIPQYTSAGKPTCTGARLNRRIRLTDTSRGYHTCVAVGSGYAWVRDSPEINAKLDFAATGDGTTDDTTNLQAASDAALAYGLGLYVPEGTYKITTTFTYHANANAWGKPLRFRGDGSRRTIFKLYANGVPAVSIKGFAVTGGIADISEGEVGEFGITQNTGQTTAIGLRIQGVTRTQFKNIEILSMSGGGLQIYASGGSGDSDLVSLCSFENILSMSNTGSGFFVTAPSASIAFSQSFFYKCYAQSNTVAGWNLANYDGIELTKCISVTNNTTTGIGIKDTYNGIFNRNLILRGNELGNGNGRAQVQLDRVVNVLSEQNRLIRNNGEAGDYGFEFLTGGTVYNFNSQNDWFTVGAAIVTCTAYKVDGTTFGARARTPYFNGTFSGSVVKVSDTTKLSIEDVDTITDTRSTMALGGLTVSGGNFRVNTAGQGYFADRLSVGTTDTATAKTYLTSAVVGLTGFQFSGISSKIIGGFNGTSANYYDADTQVFRSGNGVTSYLTITSGAVAIPLSLSINSGTALTTTNQTGTGSLVLATSPTLVTPALGVATATSLAIGSGTVITKTVVYTPILTPASVAANTSAEQTFTVTGLTTADKVIVNGPAPTAGTGIVNVRVSAADTLAITFGNFTAGGLTPTSGTYSIIAIRN